MILRIAVWAPVTAMILAGMGCSARQNQGEPPPRQAEETTQRGAAIEETPTPAAASALTTEGQAATEASATELLPDIDPQAPEGLRVGASEDGGFLLSFDAEFDNVGAGPLHIDGHRRVSSGPMVADQVIHRPDGSTELNPGVGELRFA